MKTTLLLLTFLTSLSVFAQKDEVTEFPMEESALLWQVTSENLEDTSYIFGTMHMMQADLYLYPDLLDSIVRSSDVMIMELAGIPDQLEMLELVKLENGTFFDYFTEAEASIILEWVEKNLNIDKSRFDMLFTTMKPFVLVQMITRFQFEGEVKSYEMDFTKIARENEIPLIGLETAAEQMKIFDDLSDREMADIVLQAIEDADNDDQTMNELQQMFSRQQVDSLYLYIHEDEGTITKKQNKFLDNRNSKWVPKIEELIADKRAFIAVGAGHLGGPKGVIRLMQKEGYTLIPIRL